MFLRIQWTGSQIWEMQGMEQCFNLPCVLRLSFSASSVPTSECSAKYSLNIRFETIWLSICSNSAFSLRLLYMLRAEDRLSPLDRSFEMRHINIQWLPWAPLYLCLPRLVNCVLSIQVVPTTYFGMD